MSRPKRGGFETWLRGGQTAHHTFDMTLEVIGWLSLIGAGWFLVCVCLLWNSNAATRGAGGLTLWAWFCQQVGYPMPQVINIEPITAVSVAVPVRAIWSVPEIAAPARLFWAHAIQWTAFFAGGCFLIGLGASYAFAHVGRDKVKTRQIRGQEIVRLSELIRQISEHNAATAIERRNAKLAALEEAHNATHRKDANAPAFDRAKAVASVRVSAMSPALAGVPYPLESETQHTMVVGAPGSGKTEAIHQLIDTIRERGQRAIVFDPELDFIRAHYQEGLDVILNPFDARSPGWSPFDDALDRPDWDRLGHAIFKDPKSGDPYWVEVARSLFSWTGYQLRRRNPDVELTEALELLFGPTKGLRDLLEGTPAAKHLNGIEGARVSSLESVLTNGVEPLIYLYGNRQRFSIQEWTNREVEDGGFLFLSAPESHMDAIRPLLGFWSEIAISAMLSRHEIARHPTWIILDEFHSAGKIDKLADGPQRLRKYGGAVVLGFQQISQLQDLYGPDKARTIIGQCQTKLILRAGDRDTAEVMSEQIGRRVMRRVEENTSYGANSIRDGVGLTPKEELEPILLPEDVYNLPALEGIIRVSNTRRSGPFPIAPLKIAYIERDKSTPGFVPKPNDPVDDYLNRLRQRFDTRDEPPSTARPPVLPAEGGKGAKAEQISSPSAVTGSPAEPAVDASLDPSRDAAQPPQPDSQRPATGRAKAPETAEAKPVDAAEPAPTQPPKRRGGLLGADMRGGRVVAARQEKKAAAEADAAASVGESPEDITEPPIASEGEGEDDVADQEKDMHARPKDLPTQKAEYLRRREEEDEQAVRMDKSHADRRHDVSDPNRQSVWARERDELVEGETDRGLEIGENVTAGEIHYAEAHRHEALGAALGLAVSGLVGSNVQLDGAPHRHRHPATRDEARPDDGEADERADKVDDRDRDDGEQDALSSDSGLPMPTGMSASEIRDADAVEARSDGIQEAPAWRGRARRSPSLEPPLSAEMQIQPEPDRRADPERDRDMDRELEMSR